MCVYIYIYKLLFQKIDTPKLKCPVPNLNALYQAKPVFICICIYTYIIIISD